MKWRSSYMNEKPIEIPLRKRPNYAYGMVLGVEDFRQEFAYISGRLKWLTREVLGYGTVEGLEVTSLEDSATSILVNAGTAIDPQGNEILLPSPVECPFPEEGEEGKIAYLVLYWAERDTDPVPMPGAEGEENATVPSHVEEYAILKYEADQSDEKPTGVVLARLKNVLGKWKIDKTFRVRKVKAQR
jgi:hypothetical protein